MKIPIKSLLAFSCMFLSCKQLTVVNLGEGNKEAGPNFIKAEVSQLNSEDNATYQWMVQEVKKAYEEDVKTHAIKHPECYNVVSQFAKDFIEQRGVMGNDKIHNLCYLWPVLQCAIFSGYGKMVTILIQIEKIHSGLLSVFDLLNYVICYGSLEVLQPLVQLGVDLNRIYYGEKADEHGNAFRRAVVYNRPDMASYMIEGSLIEDWGQKDIYGHTPLMYVAGSRYPGWSEVLKALVELPQKKGVDIKAQDKDGNNVLTHLINRYADIYRRYYGSRNEFIAGYNLELTDDPKGEKLFFSLCQDKRDMLNCLLTCKDISWF